KGSTRLKRRWSAGAVIAWWLLATFSATACSRGSGDQPFGGREAVPVLVATVEQKTVASRLHAIGRVEAYSTVEIKAQISGEVTEVHFKEGQDVKKGELLFTIDPRPFEAALLQAKATLAKDQAQLAQAAADERRYSFLLNERVGSPQQYDQAHAAAEANRAIVDADQAAIQTARLN